ncbi:SDR family NAD(P)-dependent oxidoreductase [Glaciimonas immobilis]|uniref:NAD(P)-dependent dehydrogenase (Short-subunit alcohol dehydrogenase family) n=1 Tax=Glaciimonas immobilis TaxID=728004 RepID=A0A840RS92_9BURK|nr:SDR family oxidoreductase [Glaciimonas immobilis]KAF3997884.1 SDR family oxidoreductase [Glaciimonas immobilis]MBB5199471.1 NAD(P)-dependent dehydrogenase (short-subunit alcohol dehydrogenase family) [Glaciimonas immobilis]
MTSPNPSYASYPSLIDRTVLISGGTTGIGADMVAQFVAQGAKVSFLGRNREAADALIASVVGEGTRHTPLFLQCDVCDIPALQAAINTARMHFGPISALVNNAANDQRQSIEETTVASWDNGMAVNLRHQFFAVQAVIEDMQTLGGGSIINLGSISWKNKTGGMPAYTTSKAAIQGLTRTLARDLGPHNIRVNTLVPGWVMTEKQIKLWLDDAGEREIDQMQCLKARLDSADISRMALFLAADDSKMCTAQDFIVDAGWS